MPETHILSTEAPSYVPADMEEKLHRLHSNAAYGPFGTSMDPSSTEGLAARERYWQLFDQHADYMQRTAEAVSQSAESTKGLYTQQLGDKPEVFHIAMSSANHDNGLPLEELGLPGISEFRPELLVIERRSGQVLSFRAFGVVDKFGKPDITEYYLENHAAAFDPNTSLKPTWYYPGEAKLSLRTRASLDISDYPDGSKQIVVSRNPDESDVELQVVRRSPTKEERAAAQELTPGNKERKRARKIRLARAGFAAGVAVAAAFTSIPEDGTPQHEIKTAEDAVMPAHTHADQSGIKQAEAYYDPATLDRSRDAYRAYLAGNKDGLRQIAEQYGYQRDWMTGQALSAVENAKNRDELIAALNAALGDAPINVELYDTKFPGKLDETYETQNRLTEDDMPKAAKTAADVLAVLNRLNRSKLVPTQIILASDLRMTKPTKDLNDVAGYYSDVTPVAGTDQIVPTVVLDTNDTTEDIVAHELTHALADNNVTEQSPDPSGVAFPLTDRVAALTPDDFMQGWYVGQDDFKKTSVKEHGLEISRRSYSRVNKDEDTATAGESLFAGKLRLDTDPLDEKVQAILFDYEHDNPGATAALLLDSPIPKSGVANTAERMGEAIQGRFDGWRVGINSVALLLLGAQTLGEAGAAASRLRRKFKRRRNH